MSRGDEFRVDLTVRICPYCGEVGHEAEICTGGLAAPHEPMPMLRRPFAHWLAYDPGAGRGE